MPADGPGWLERANSLEELSDQAAWYESLDEDEQDAADAMLTELSQEDAERIIGTASMSAWSSTVAGTVPLRSS